MSINNHKAACTICNHAQRKELEDDFINGFSVLEICEKYKIERYTLERHLRRFPKIREERSNNIVRHLDRFLEHSSIGRFHIDSPDFLKAASLKAETKGLIKRGTVVNQNTTVNVAVVEEARKKNLEAGLNRFQYTLANEDKE